MTAIHIYFIAAWQAPRKPVLTSHCIMLSICQSPTISYF